MKNLRIVLLAFLLVAVLFMAWWFVLTPNNEKKRAMETEITDKQTKLRELNQAQGMVGNLESEIRSYENAIVWFQGKLPKEREIDRVLKEIWVLARQNDLAPKSVKPLERPARNAQAPLPEFCAEQPILLELEGDFLGLYKFMQAVETQPRIMRISMLELSRDTKQLPGQLKATLAMSIYFEKAVAPPMPAAPAKTTKTRGT